MRRLAFTLVALLMLLPGLSYASEWSVKGFLDQDLSYDDNVFMAVNNRRDSFRYRIIPTITFQHRTDVSNLAANATYGTQIYTGVEGFDQEIQHYDVNGSYKFEKLDLNMNGRYSITPTRNLAVQNSGIFNNNSSQDSWSVAPTATYHIDDIDSLTFSSSYNETTFSNAGNGAGGQPLGFNDSQSYTFNLAWQRLWGPRFSSGVAFFYNNVESQVQIRDDQEIIPIPTIFDNFGINFSNTYMLGENWRLTGIIGGRYTQSEIGATTDESFGFLADVGINYTGEIFSTGLHFNRGLVPATFGQLQEQTSVSLNFSYQVLEKLTTHLNTSYQESTVVNSNSALNNAVNAFRGTRTNFVIEPSVRWQFDRDWSLGGSYRYRTQEGQNIVGADGTFNNGEADSNLFLISIHYNWPGYSMSK